MRHHLVTVTTVAVPATSRLWRVWLEEWIRPGLVVGHIDHLIPGTDSLTADSMP